MLGLGEGSDDAVDRLLGVVRVQRREDEVTGLGGGDRELHRRLVSHLAHEDDVRVLPQRRAQRRHELVGIDAEFALVDGGELVGVDELDRVLDRYYVHRTRLVHVLDDRGERRRLAAAGRPGHDNEAVRMVGDFLEDLGQAHGIDRRHLERHVAEGRADVLALNEGVDAETADVRDLVGEVGLQGLLELPLHRGRHDPEHGLLHLLPAHLGEGAGEEVPRDAEEGRPADLQMKVAAFPLDQLVEQFVEIHGPSWLPSLKRRACARKPLRRPRRARPRMPRGSKNARAIGGPAARAAICPPKAGRLGRFPRSIPRRQASSIQGGCQASGVPARGDPVLPLRHTCGIGWRVQFACRRPDSSACAVRRRRPTGL